MDPSVSLYFFHDKHTHNISFSAQYNFRPATFSTFSTDIVAMVGKGEVAKACSYLMVNNVGGVTAAAAGMMVAKKFFGM